MEKEAYIIGMKMTSMRVQVWKSLQSRTFSFIVVTGFIAFTKFILDPKKLDPIYWKIDSHKYFLKKIGKDPILIVNLPNSKNLPNLRTL